MMKLLGDDAWKDVGFIGVYSTQGAVGEGDEDQEDAPKKVTEITLEHIEEYECAQKPADNYEDGEWQPVEDSSIPPTLETIVEEDEEGEEAYEESFKVH